MSLYVFGLLLTLIAYAAVLLRQHAIITDGDQGILVPPDDEGALARAITAVLQDPAAGRAIGARARQRIVDRYDIQRTAGRWLDAYHTVLAGKR